MKNEIKEMNFSEMLFNRDERLLDYITNLQEELERCVKANIILDDENAELQGEKQNLQEENESLKKDLKTLWNVCWNNDTEMTSYQNEVFDNYYDMFHKNSGDN